jgi:hypothetical protein
MIINNQKSEQIIFPSQAAARRHAMAHVLSSAFRPGLLRAFSSASDACIARASASSSVIPPCASCVSDASIAAAMAASSS